MCAVQSDPGVSGMPSDSCGDVDLAVEVLEGPCVVTTPISPHESEVSLLSHTAHGYS